MKRISLTVVLCIVLKAVFAQEAASPQQVTVKDSLPIKPAKAASRSYFAASVSYLSNSVFNGRKDSVATPYLTPMIGYYNKSGFFADGSLSYLATSGSSRIDLVNFEAGYDFSIGDFDGEVVAGKPFYNSSSTNVKSEITGTLAASGGYDFSFIKPTFEAGINFGTKADYLLAFGLEHTFYALDDKLLITPGALANGSTQNYYGSYYNKRKVGGRKKKAGVVYDVTAEVEGASDFKMLDYQFSLPFIYIVHKFSFILTPVYVLPVHPALITVTRKPESGGNTVTKTSLETISNTFYCSLGISYKF